MLAASVAVVNKPHALGRSAFMDGLLEGVENEPGMREGADAPATDRMSLGVDDESDLDEPFLSGHVGKV